MKTDPQVSIIIPCFKMGKFLPEALESVASQTFGAWEIIAVDDADPEATTRGIVEEFKMHHPGKRIECIRHERNQGLGASRNTGIAASNGELVAFLDADDIWLPGYLEAAVDVFRASPNVSVTNAQLAFFGTRFGKKLDRDMPFVPPRWQIERFPDSLGVTNFIAPSATVVRREALEKVGGFATEEEIRFVEDYDLWVRLVEAGCEFSFIEKVLVRYRRHPGAAAEDTALIARRQKVIAEKHGVFMMTSMRRLICSLYSGHEGLESLVKSPISRLADKFRLVLGRLPGGRR